MTGPYECRTGEVVTFLTDVRNEFARATAKFPAGFHSGHEGYAVIKEELEELWSEVKCNDSSGERAYREAVQVAAMALRYVIDLRCSRREPCA